MLKCKFIKYMDVLLESASKSNFGTNSLLEAYPPINTNVKELTNSLLATNMTVSQWTNPIASMVFAELNHNFAQLGVSFDEETDLSIHVNYPESGIVWAETDQTTKLIYVYVNKLFLNKLVTPNISRKELAKVAKDLYAQLAHEDTHRYQFSQSKVTLVPNLPIVNNKSSNRKYIQNIHEIDAFAKQLAFELFRDVSHDTAINWLRNDSPKLLEYQAYKTYKELVGGEAQFCIRDKQKDPNLKLTKYQKKCIFTWNRFRQRTAWFLDSLYRNHFVDSAPDISSTNILIEEVISY